MTLRYTVPVSGTGDDPELLSARLWEAGASGVWDRDDVLVAWFDERTHAVPAGGTWEEEPARDWLADWRRDLDPIVIGPLTVTPSWRLAEVRSGAPTVTDPGIDHVIVVDPAMAFGTGHHATTRFCIERLLDLEVAGARVLDVGTGTGILAIAARRLGAVEVVAIDDDPEAVSAAVDNAARNGADVEVLHGDLGVVDERTPFDVVLANLVTDTVIELAGDLLAATRPGGRVVTSGIGRDRCHEVVTALLAAGADTPTVRAESTWAEVTARRPSARSGRRDRPT